MDSPGSAPDTTLLATENAQPARFSVTPAPAMDAQHERRPLVGERLHRRVDAEELLRVADADSCFPAATRTSLD